MRNKIRHFHDLYLSFRTANMKKQVNNLLIVNIVTLVYGILAYFFFPGLFTLTRNYGKVEYAALISISGVMLILNVIGYFIWKYKGFDVGGERHFEAMTLFDSLYYLTWTILVLQISLREGREPNVYVPLMVTVVCVSLMVYRPWHFITSAAALTFIAYHLIIVAGYAIDRRLMGDVIFFVIVIAGMNISKYIICLEAHKNYLLNKDFVDNREKFLVNVTHEMRTPLNAILGKNQMILQSTDEENTLGLASDINNTGKILQCLINDILDLSKLQAGKMNIIPANYNVSEIAYGIADIMRTEATTKALDFELDFDSALPSVLYGDAVRIKQIIINLLSNAIKYTSKGKVVFHMGFKPGENETGILTVAVTDTGMGIREEDLAKLATAYVRVNEDKVNGTTGTGLGLSIVANLLNLMNSKLEISSVYGEGSTFGFSIEQKIIDLSPMGIHMTNKPAKFEVSFKAPGKRALVVDDVRTNFVVANQFLKYYKVHSDWAGNAADCLAKLKENRYDIIFLDHMMPGINGIECLEKIKEQFPDIYSSVPIIALTANVFSDSRTFYRRYGFSSHLGKPIDLEKLDELMVEFVKDK